MPLKNKNFLALFGTQFFGALNDNIFKNALVVLIAYKGVQLWGLDSKSIVALASGIFILPFFLFSSIAGQLSDKFEKANLARLTKYLEVVIMLFGSLGFYFHHFSLLMASLFFMGLQSTFFGPIKYSIIPELVPDNQLTAGNAYVEMGTFIAILVGTIFGGLAASMPSSEIVISISILTVAALGVATSLFIPKVPIADADIVIAKNPMPQFFKTMRLARINKLVYASIFGISWFWFFGAGLLSILPTLTKEVLNADEHVVTLFLATFTIGIAAGAFVCEQLSKKKLSTSLVSLGALGMTVFLLDLAYMVSSWPHSAPPLANSTSPLLTLIEFLSTSGSTRITFDLFVVSVFGGLYTVPLYTLMQQRSERKVRSQVVASNNILNALFMVISSLMLMALYAFQFSIPQIIVVYAFLNLLVLIYICFVVPEFFIRLRRQTFLRR